MESQDNADRLVKALDTQQPGWIKQFAHHQELLDLLEYAQQQPEHFPQKLASVKRNTALALLSVMHIAHRYEIKAACEQGGRP